jgi:hypothetical protein
MVARQPPVLPLLPSLRLHWLCRKAHCVELGLATLDLGRQQTPDLDFDEPARLRAKYGPCQHTISLLHNHTPAAVIRDPQSPTDAATLLLSCALDITLGYTRHHSVPVAHQWVAHSWIVQQAFRLPPVSATPLQPLPLLYQPAIVACTCLDCPLQTPSVNICTSVPAP